MDYLHIQLEEGRRVRDPYTAQVMQGGKIYKVRPVQFWLRRIESGDVKIVEPQESAKPVQQKKKAKEKSGD